MRILYKSMQDLMSYLSHHHLKYSHSPLPLRLPLSSQSRTKLPQQQRSRNPNNQRQESQHTITPSIAQSLIHTRSKDRENEGGNTAQELARRRSGRRILWKRIQYVSLHSLCAQNNPRSEDTNANICNDPIRSELASPSIPEQSDGNEQAAWNHHWHAILGCRGAGSFARQVRPDTICIAGTHLRSEGVSDCERDVVEAGLRYGLAVVLGPEFGKGGEHDVVDAEVVGHEDGHDLESGLGEEEAHGAG